MAVDDSGRQARALSILISMSRESPARAQLIELCESYLGAVLAHDPARGPLSKEFRATENTVPVPLGAGLWRSAEAFLGKHYFVDEQAGQAIIMGAVQVAGDLRPLMLRLRACEGQITEAEAIVSRDARGHFADVDRLLNADILYDAPVPPERACNRERLQAAADRYWIALGESDGSLARFNYRCDRFGNGKKITNNLSTLLSPDGAVHTVASCITATRPARPSVAERRFPVLDVERGVAASIVVVEFAPNPTNPRPDTGAFYMLGVFKIVDEEIRIIDEIHEIMPRGSRSGW